MHVDGRLMLAAGDTAHFPLLMGFSIGQPECPHDTGADFPKVRDPRETARQKLQFC